MFKEKLFWAAVSPCDDDSACWRGVLAGRAAGGHSQTREAVRNLDHRRRLRPAQKLDLYLHNEPYHCDFARTGCEALGKLFTNEYDFVLLDLGLQLLAITRRKHGVKQGVLAFNPFVLNVSDRALRHGEHEVVITKRDSTCCTTCCSAARRCSTACSSRSTSGAA